MGSCGAFMSAMKIMSPNLVPLFGYYTFINNQISVQRLQAWERREGTESIGGIEFFTYSHKTSHPVNNLALIPARHHAFGSCLSPWLRQNWQLYAQLEGFQMVRQVCFVFLPSHEGLLQCPWIEHKQLAHLQLHIGLASRGYELRKKYVGTSRAVLKTQDMPESEAWNKEVKAVLHLFLLRLVWTLRQETEAASCS